MLKLDSRVRVKSYEELRTIALAYKDNGDLMLEHETFCFEEMIHFCNQYFTIIGMEQRKDFESYYLEEREWTFTEEMLEEIPNGFEEKQFPKEMYNLNLSDNFLKWVLSLTEDFIWVDSEFEQKYIKYIFGDFSYPKVEILYLKGRRAILHDIIYQVLQGIKKSNNYSLSDFKNSVIVIKHHNGEKIVHKTFYNEEYACREAVYFAAFQWLFNDET